MAELPERIDLNDTTEVAAWIAALGVSESDLQRIVAQVGNSSDNVREHVLLRR
jgi:hypothetical protein